MTRGRRNPAHLGLAARLGAARKRAGLSRRALARAAELAEATAGNVERGRIPGLDVAERLARALGVTACWLAYGHYGSRPFQNKIPRAEQVEGLPEQGPPMPRDAPLTCLQAGARLERARTACGLSRLALARAAGLTDTTVRLTEEGRNIPSVATTEKLAAALEVSPCWLAYGEGAAPPGLGIR